jgi:hypothetical protein
MLEGRSLLTASYAKSRLNDNVAGRTELGAAQRITAAVLCADLRVVTHRCKRFLCQYSRHVTFCCSVDIIMFVCFSSCVTDTVQVTEGRMLAIVT